MDLLRSLPVGLYLEQPFTWLHRLDPRVKLAFLMTFLLSPILANSLWRLILVGLLVLLTAAARIPLRACRQQMGWLLVLCGTIAALSAVFPDGVDVKHQPRLPADELAWEMPSPAEKRTDGNGICSGIDRRSPQRNRRSNPCPNPGDYRYVLVENAAP